MSLYISPYVSCIFIDMFLIYDNNNFSHLFLWVYVHLFYILNNSNSLPSQQGIYNFF